MRSISVSNSISGAEDLKGHIMKHRGDMMQSIKSGENEGQNVQVILEQAEHELRHGDPEVYHITS